MSRPSRLLVATLLLASCTTPVGPQDSGIQTPSLWSRLTSSEQAKKAPETLDTNAPVDQQWWMHFNDPVLNDLIGQALKNNPSLAIAKSRVEEARAERLGARSALFPQISGSTDASRGNQGLGTFYQPMTVENADLNATWELDLFGKNQARVAQTNALLQSAEASAQGVRVSLLAEVARTYFDLRDTNRQIELTQKNLDTENETLKLTRDQMKAAFASGLDVERTAAQAASTQARLPSLQTQRVHDLNRLSVLVGATPGSEDKLLSSLPPLAPLDQSIVVNAPATVLAARPDVRVAERNLAASVSAADVATRELFPDISLTGLFGVQDAPGFFSGRTWSLGAGLTQPILNFGRIQSDIDAANAEQQQAFLNYQKTVLEALEDMENALSAYGQETARNAALHEAAARAEKASALAHDQYRSGYTGLLDVLEAQRDALSAEAAAASSDLILRTDLVAIYTAAGGGWEEASAKPAAAASPHP